MAETLSSIINKLKHTSRLLEGVDISDILTSIDELSEDDKIRIFFLSQLLQHRSNSLTSASVTIKHLHAYIENNNLASYYNQQDIPGSKYSWMNGLSILIGLLVVLGGVFEISHKHISVGLDSRYHSFHVDGGGDAIVFGLILIIIGGLRLKYRNRQNQLLRRIIDEQDN